MSTALQRNVRVSSFELGRAHTRRWRSVMAIAGLACTAWCCTTFATALRGDSLRDIGERMPKTYAYAAYFAFRHAHPERACPRDLAELNEWTGMRDTHDPWGFPYAMHCSAADGMLVLSRGEDGRWNTADDIRSDQ